MWHNRQRLSPGLEKMSEISRERRLEQVYGARSNDELRALYDDWAGRYDQDLQAFGYSYPPAIAGLVARYVSERDAPILDAGAGTGIVGEVLAILGYTRITGIDLSDGMLAVARAKGVYAELRNQTLGERARLRRRRVRRGGLGRRPDHGARAAFVLRRADPGHPAGRSPDLHAQHAGLRRRRLQAEARSIERQGAVADGQTTPTWCSLPRAPSRASVLARAYVFEVL